jgi:hypothetical protein
MFSMRDCIDEIGHLQPSFVDIEKVRKERGIEPMEIFLSTIPDFFDENDCGLLDNICKLQKLIINSSKKEDFDSAFEYMQVIRYLLKRFNNETARIAGNSLCLPSFSFFYFKKRHFKRSINCITTLCKQNDGLYCTFPIFHLHKIHHIMNLVDVYIAKKQYETAGKIMKDIILYHGTGAIPEQWGEGSFEHLNALSAIISADQLTNTLFSPLFVSSWRHRRMREVLFNDEEFIIRMNNALPEKSHFYAGLVSFFTVMKSFITAKVSYDIPVFFSRFKDFEFDGFKLLLLREIYTAAQDEYVKKDIEMIIKEKLRFKSTDEILQQLCL